MSPDAFPITDIARRVQILTAAPSDPDGAYSAPRQCWQDRQWCALASGGAARLVETAGYRRRWRLTPTGRAHARGGVA